MSNNHSAQIKMSHDTYKKAVSLLSHGNSINIWHNILRQATILEKVQAYLISLINTIVRRYRVWLGFCPACNSSAPECDTCQECNNSTVE